MTAINRNGIIKGWTGKASSAGMVEEGLKHIVYDLSIENIEERKQKAMHFDTANQVAHFLGYNVDTVFKKRIHGKNIKSISGKLYAVRTIKQ